MRVQARQTTLSRSSALAIALLLVLGLVGAATRVSAVNPIYPITLVTTGTGGTGVTGGGMGSSLTSSVSDNGRYIAFESQVADVTAGDTNNAQDAFVYDSQTGTTRLVSTTATNGPANGGQPQLSGDGSLVVFTSDSSAFGYGFGTHVYAKNLTSGSK